MQLANLSRSDVPVVTRRKINGNFAAINRPTLFWRCDTEADALEVERWTGQPVTHVHGFANSQGNWVGVVNLVKGEIAKFPNRKIAWALPLATGLPGSPPTRTTTMAQVAAGNFDAEINMCFDLILAHNPQDEIPLRLGWEAGNLSQWPWGATSTDIPNQRTDYIAAFRRVSAMARAKSQNFQVIWNVGNVSFTPIGDLVNPLDPATGYDPGEAYYQGVGIDHYMASTDVSNGLRWDDFWSERGVPPLLADGSEFGIGALFAHARKYDKFLSYDEVGVGEERPDYFVDAFRAAADPMNNVKYIGIWNKNAPAAPQGPYDFPCRLSDSTNDYPLTKQAVLNALFNIGEPIPSEQPETSPFIARSTATVSVTDRDRYNTILRYARTAGLLPYLDALFILCGPDPVTALINPYGAGGFTTKYPRVVGRGDIVGSPSFIPYRGFSGDGNVGNLIRLNSINPGASPAPLNMKFSKNSAHMGIFSLTATAHNNLQTFEAGNGNSFIARIGSGDRWVARMNLASTVTITPLGNDAGHVMWNRSSDVLAKAYFNGVETVTSVLSTSAVTLTNDDFRLCGVPGIGANGMGINRLSVFHMGSALPVNSLINGPLEMRNLCRLAATLFGAL